MKRDTPHARGIAHPMHPAVLGAVIGMLGGSMFMLVSRPELPGPWPTITLIAWIALLAAAAWAVFLAPRRLRDVGAPSRFAGPIYGASVLGMVVLIIASPHLVRALGIEAAQPAVVVMAVGLHFIPFAVAFGARVFAWLGWALTAIGLAGVLAAAGVGHPAGAVSAVLAGAAMLAFLAVDARRGAPAPVAAPAH